MKTSKAVHIKKKKNVSDVEEEIKPLCPIIN